MTDWFLSGANPSSGLASLDPFGLNCLLAATAGVSAHLLYFIRGYHDKSAFWIFTAHVVAMLMTGYSCTRAYGTLSLAAGRATILLSMMYFGALFTSIGIYRLAFHPLRRFPGPLLARLSKTVYGPYSNIRRKMHLEHTRLHEKYGDFVRVGPNELSILSADALAKVHGPQSRCSKQLTAYENVSFRGEQAVNVMTDLHAHRWRRQTWDKAVASTKALNQYEPLVRQVVHEWLDKITSLKGGPIDVSLFMLLITLETVGHVGFSKSFGGLKEGKATQMLDVLRKMFATVAQLGTLGWPISFLSTLGVRGDAAAFDKLAFELANEKEKNPGHDIMQYFLDDFNSPNPKTFHNRNVLLIETESILTGATDTAAAVLAFAFSHLARHLSAQETLYNELQPLFGKSMVGEFAARDLEDDEAPYLNSIINETMRLHNPSLNGGLRKLPSEGLVIDDVHIPGNVLVLTPHYSIYRSDKYFGNPNEFIPERWTTRPDLVTDHGAFMPFLQGTYSCPGRRFALNTMRLVLAYTVKHYSVRFAPGEIGEAIDRELENQMILHPGPCRCVFDKRD